MMSETASRPPGFRTRKASRNTCALSGTRLITQFERIDIGGVVGDREVLEFAKTEFDVAPRRSGAALSRALFSISWVMSTPMT